MNTSSSALGIAVLTVAVIAISCPEPDERPPPERFPVDSQTFPERLKDNLQQQRDAYLESTNWIEDTRLHQRTGLPSIDRPDDELDEDFQALTSFLTQTVFAPEHVEDETQTSITYRLDGQRVCTETVDDLPEFDSLPPDDPEAPLGAAVVDLQDFHALGDFNAQPQDRSDDGDDTDGWDRQEQMRCAEYIDAADIQLRVTSPAPDEFSISTTVAGGLYQPVFATVGEEISLLDIDVHDLAEAIMDTQETVGDDEPDPFDEPTTMEQQPDERPDYSGRIQWSFEIDMVDQTRTNLTILRPVEIEIDDTRLEIASGDPFFEEIVDGTDEEITTFFASELIELQFPIGEDPSDRQTGSLTAEGLRFEAQLDSERDDRWRATDIGLAQPLVFALDGDPVFSVQRNSAGTDRYDATLRAGADRTEIALRPPTQWTVDFQFEEVMDDGSLLAWMSDDTWTIGLTDADEPTLAFHDFLVVEVLEGTLRLESTRADRVLQIDTGQCLQPLGTEFDDQEFDDPEFDDEDSPPSEDMVLMDVDFPPPPDRSPDRFDDDQFDSNDGRKPRDDGEQAIGLHPLHLLGIGPCP